jgi:hypothetical protein
MEGKIMKIHKTIILIIIIIITIIGCNTLGPELLEPSEIELKDKLLPLQFGLSGENIIKQETTTTITVQSDFATLIERELSENIYKMEKKDGDTLK